MTKRKKTKNIAPSPWSSPQRGEEMGFLLPIGERDYRRSVGKGEGKNCRGEVRSKKETSPHLNPAKLV
jgi:hypothetical protein